MTPEGRNEKYLREKVKAEGGTVRKIRWLGRRNCPDDIVWFGPPLRCGLVECKRPRKDATAAQEREHRKLREAGWLVFVGSNEAEIDAAVMAIKGESA